MLLRSAFKASVCQWEMFILLNYLYFHSSPSDTLLNRRIMYQSQSMRQPGIICLIPLYQYYFKLYIFVHISFTLRHKIDQYFLSLEKVIWKLFLVLWNQSSNTSSKTAQKKKIWTLTWNESHHCEINIYIKTYQVMKTTSRNGSENVYIIFVFRK